MSAADLYADSATWMEFYLDGRRYLRTARGALKRPAVFSPEIIFNLVAMGIEKIAMAMLLEAGDIADNHTMPDLLKSLSRVVDLDLELAQAILDLGRYEDLCAFSPRLHQTASMSDLPAIVAVGEELLVVAQAHLPAPATLPV